MLNYASDHDLIPFGRNRLLQALVALFAVAWLIGAIAPLDRFAWFLENLLVFLSIGLLMLFYHRRALSNFSYLLITLFLLLHTLGAHYTYSLTPPGFWLQDIFSLERNPYDRVIHFCFGLLIVYPLNEVLVRYSGASLRMSAFTAFATIATSSVGYEIVEWVVAIIVSPDAAMAYLGTQGDPFDAQKDSLLAIVGALVGLALTRRMIGPKNAE